jgi:hypothetical protein
VDQVSKPVLIVLAAVVVLASARFTIMRPKDDSASTPPVATAPGQTGLSNAVNNANHAVGANNAAVKNHEKAAAAASGESAASASGGTVAPSKQAKAAAKPAPKPASAAPAKPVTPELKLAPGDRSGPILRELASGKVAVVLFYSGAGADDHAALRAVRHVDRHHGRVKVHAIRIKNVGSYDAITTGVQVLQSPTVVVIGPDRKARTIVGYTEVKEVEQMVGDVGGKGFTAKPAFHLTGFAAKASDICQDTGFSVVSSGLSDQELSHALTRVGALLHRDRRRVAAVPAVGAKQRAAKRALLAFYDSDAALIPSARAKLRSGAEPGSTLLGMIRSEDGFQKRARPALHAVHEHHCFG